MSLASAWASVTHLPIIVHLRPHLPHLLLSSPIQTKEKKPLKLGMKESGCAVMTGVIVRLFRVWRKSVFPSLPSSGKMKMKMMLRKVDG